MASDVEICNRALQKLGAKRIVSLTDNSVNARACNAAFVPVRQAELRKHFWSFAIERAELAADSPAPTWGRENSFTLPSNFLLLAPNYAEDLANDDDRLIEGRKIITDESAPLYVRYVKDVTDANQMDSLFREAFACALAIEICEEITNSTNKKDTLKIDYRDAIRDAKRMNAIEKPPEATPEDTWVTVRD